MGLPWNDDVEKTLSLIASARLPHPSGALLSAFITEALNPIIASSYVSDRLQKEDCRTLVSDWIYIVESSTSHSPWPIC